MRFAQLEVHRETKSNEWSAANDFVQSEKWENLQQKSDNGEKVVKWEWARNDRKIFCCFWSFALKMSENRSSNRSRDFVSICYTLPQVYCDFRWKKLHVVFLLHFAVFTAFNWHLTDEKPTSKRVEKSIIIRTVLCCHEWYLKLTGLKTQLAASSKSQISIPLIVTFFRPFNLQRLVMRHNVHISVSDVICVERKAINYFKWKCYWKLFRNLILRSFSVYFLLDESRSWPLNSAQIWFIRLFFWCFANVE